MLVLSPPQRPEVTGYLSGEWRGSFIPPIFAKDNKKRAPRRLNTSGVNLTTKVVKRSYGRLKSNK